MTNSAELEAKALDPEPWRGLPPRVADLIEAEIPATTAEILEAFPALRRGDLQAVRTVSA